MQLTVRDIRLLLCLNSCCGVVDLKEDITSVEGAEAQAALVLPLNYETASLDSRLRGRAEVAVVLEFTYLNLSALDN